MFWISGSFEFRVGDGGSLFGVGIGTPVPFSASVAPCSVGQPRYAGCSAALRPLRGDSACARCRSGGVGTKGAPPSPALRAGSTRLRRVERRASLACRSTSRGRARLKCSRRPGLAHRLHGVQRGARPGSCQARSRRRRWPKARLEKGLAVRHTRKPVWDAAHAMPKRQLLPTRFSKEPDFFCPAARLAVEIDGGSHDH
jgi:hypothetical protein